MSKTDIDIDLLWDCYYSWEDKTKGVVTELAKLLTEHIGNDRNHYYNNKLADKFKEMEENNKGLTKYLKEKIEELYARRKQPDKYIIK